MKEAETDRKTVKSTDTDTDETAAEDREATAESDTKTEERDRQTVTATAAEAAAVTATETDAETKRVTGFRSRMNIRLLAAIQMMLKVLFISQTSLLHFYVNQSNIRQDTFLFYDDICYYTC